jgi:tRNA wybutosine-synthesizing protein 4
MMVLAECVLAYLSPEHSDPLLAGFPRGFPRCAFAGYEPFRLDDPFGAVMKRNLEARGCPMLGAAARRDPDASARRFVSAPLGWAAARCFDLNEVHDHAPSAADRARVARIEMLDEVEEWRIILAHYAITVACAGVDWDPLASFLAGRGVEATREG